MCQRCERDVNTKITFYQDSNVVHVIHRKKILQFICLHLPFKPQRNEISEYIFTIQRFFLDFCHHDEKCGFVYMLVVTVTTTTNRKL